MRDALLDILDEWLLVMNFLTVLPFALILQCMPSLLDDIYWVAKEYGIGAGKKSRKGSM